MVVSVTSQLKYVRYLPVSADPALDDRFSLFTCIHCSGVFNEINTIYNYCRCKLIDLLYNIFPSSLI